MSVYSTLVGGRATFDMLGGLPQELAFPAVPCVTAQLSLG